MRATRLTTQLRELLPFRLTAAQGRVIREIFDDMAKPHPLHRLVQGDIGSGKTIVQLTRAQRRQVYERIESGEVQLAVGTHALMVGIDVPNAILGEARLAAEAWLRADPKLEHAESQALRAVLVHRWAGRLELAEIG